MDTEDFNHLLSQGIAEGNIPASQRSMWLSVNEQNQDLAARTLTAVVDAGTSQVIGEEPDHASHKIANPVRGFSSFEAAAETLSIPLTAVPQLAQIEDDIVAAAASPAPERPDVHFLDYRPLSTPADPWSSDDWERDVRRAEAAELDLDHDFWEVHVARGNDAVSVLWNERQQADIDALQEWRSRYIDIANGQFNDARDAKWAQERTDKADLSAPAPARPRRTLCTPRIATWG